MLDYARTRAVESGRRYSPDEAREIITKSTRVLANLRPTTLKILQQNPPGPIEASLVAAINEVIDYHTIRNMTVFDTLPTVVILLLIFVTSAAVAVAGFNAGLSGRISRWRMTIFALVLAGVVLVIQDFDRPLSGFIQVSHDSIQSVKADMEAELAKQARAMAAHAARRTNELLNVDSDNLVIGRSL